MRSTFRTSRPPRLTYLRLCRRRTEGSVYGGHRLRQLRRQLFKSDLTGDFCTCGSKREFNLKERWCALKKYKPEQIVTLLRQMEVEIASGKTTPQACEETYNRSPRKPTTVGGRNSPG